LKGVVGEKEYALPLNCTHVSARSSGR
jgi:hypothetical protein